MPYVEKYKGEIYEEYSEKILRYIKCRISNPEEAEDLCSEVFLKIYQKLDTFDETKASVTTWIYTVTRNTLTDHYRTRHVLEEVPETVSDGSDIEEEICNAEMLEILASAIEKLDERSRDIIVLRYYSGLTLKEIGSRMGYSYAYIKALHNKALASLKKFF